MNKEKFSNSTNTPANDKWYDKFSKKPKEQKSKQKQKIKAEDSKKKNISAEKKIVKRPSSYNVKKNSLSILSHSKMFDQKALPEDAVKILNDFTAIIQTVQPLNSRQLAKVPLSIRDLSHELTDERSERYKSYMNETVRLSSYVRYFMWWNLVRLTRLFASIKDLESYLSDEDVCLDIGSGPLTLVIALWLARPELRKKKLTWYCLDISSSSLSMGEELYMSIAAKTLKDSDSSPWKIVRVKGEFGTFIKQKASFVTSANMFNELLQLTDMPPDYSAKKYCDTLLGYTTPNAAVLVVEPGVPKSARLLSLMRDSFMRKNYSPVFPCTHKVTCPMDGKVGGKWCNFAFSTDDAPAKLLKLSEAAGIPKERAVLSALLVSNKETQTEDENLKLRIASDSIRLPGFRTGYYACSELGLVLTVKESNEEIFSGDLIEVKKISNTEKMKRDQKTDALEITI